MKFLVDMPLSRAPTARLRTEGRVRDLVENYDLSRRSEY